MKMHDKRYWARWSAPALLAVLFFLSCDGNQKPIDGKTRQVIDSLVTASIGSARKEVDSLCVEERRVRLPFLVDSIRQQRQREIDKKLGKIPR